MQLSMISNSDAAGFPARNWDLAIVGPILDERGKSAVSFVKSSAKRMITMSYDSNELNVTVDGVRLEVDEIGQLLGESGIESIVLETTTLGFVETYLCCRAWRDTSHEGVSLTYLEPMRYFLPHRYDVVLRRDFELSEEVAGYRAIPGCSFELDERRPQKCVFCVGFEGQRLEQALEDLPLNPKSCFVLFGVPAFRPGWEMDSFANNIRTIRERGLGGGIFFCGANNPKAVLETLELIYNGKSTTEDMFVAGIGTKPHGIGAALFACNHPDVGLLYDHPTRKTNRSHNQGVWHLFDAIF